MVGDEIPRPEFLCRVCKIPLIPPDPNRKYRTIRCGKCNEVTPVGPPPEDKKYALCSCNALLIVPDDASIFNCTRCKKIRTVQQVSASQTPRGGVDGAGGSGGEGGGGHGELSRAPSFSTLRAPSFGLLRTTSVATIRHNLVRTISTQSVSLEERSPSATLENAPPNTISRTMSIQSFAGDPEDYAETKLNEDQKFILDFFSARVRPSVIGWIDGNKFWIMRLKVLMCVIYNVIVSVLILSEFLKQEFGKQFGFETYDTWLACVLFVPYIASFSIEWAFNKIFVYGYIAMCMWFAMFAAFDPLKVAFFWNFYDTGHLLDEVMIRAFYLRIPRLQIPFYRFTNPPQHSQIESEFFYLSDIHLMSLVFKHPKIHMFFKVSLGFFIFVKTLGKASVILALILLPFNALTIFYAAETFLSTVWMIFSWSATNKSIK